MAFSARTARVLIGGLSMEARRWSISVRVDELEVSTFESVGFTNYIDGLMDADVSADCFWNQSVNGGNPPVIYPGLSLFNNRFYLSGSAAGQGFALGTYFYFPAMLITNSSTDAEVRNTVNVSLNAKNQGPFYFPGQSAVANPRGVSL